jgi:hypothetical protein
LMTHFEYFEKLMAEKSLAADNLKIFFELLKGGEQTTYKEALSKYYALDAECDKIFKAFSEGALNPDAEKINSN